MTNIAEVIGWKFNHQEGMSCKEIVNKTIDEKTGKETNEYTGVLAITEFPGDIPSQADQDKWTAEYEAHLVAKITDPVEYPLNPSQFEAILALLNITIEQIDAAVDKLPFTAAEKAFAKAKARKATSYHRDNELFGLLGPIMGISDASIDAAWMEAKDFK